MHDARAAAAPLALKLNLDQVVFLPVNLLKLQSLVRLLRRITRKGIRARRLLRGRGSCL